MGKKFCNLPIWQRADIQNLQKLKQIYKKKTNKPIQKWEKDMNRHFSKEDIYEGNKHEKNVHHHWSLEKCKWKPHWDITSCQLEWLSLKNLETDAREDVEKKKHFSTDGGSVN